MKKTALLAPYGAGNHVPVFALRGARILDIKTLSDGKHCRILAESRRRVVEAIAFGAGSLVDEYFAGDVVDLAGELNINLYNGQTRLQIILCNIRFSKKLPEDVLPDRRDFVDIYRYLSKKGSRSVDAVHITKRLYSLTGRRITRDKLINALRIFSDVGILRYHLLGDVVQITMLETEKGKKIAIDKSKEYQKIREEAKKLLD